MTARVHWRILSLASIAALLLVALVVPLATDSFAAAEQSSECPTVIEGENRPLSVVRLELDPANSDFNIVTFAGDLRDVEVRQISLSLPAGDFAEDTVTAFLDSDSRLSTEDDVNEELPLVGSASAETLDLSVPSGTGVGKSDSFDLRLRADDALSEDLRAEATVKFTRTECESNDSVEQGTFSGRDTGHAGPQLDEHPAGSTVPQEGPSDDPMVEGGAEPDGYDPGSTDRRLGVQAFSVNPQFNALEQAGKCSVSTVQLPVTSYKDRQGFNTDRDLISMTVPQGVNGSLGQLTVTLRNTNRAVQTLLNGGKPSSLDRVRGSQTAHFERYATYDETAAPGYTFTVQPTYKYSQGVQLEFPTPFSIKSGDVLQFSFPSATIDGRAPSNVSSSQVSASFQLTTCVDGAGNVVDASIGEDVPVGDPPYGRQDVATIRVHARAFLAATGPQIDATASNDFRFTRGAEFQLWSGTKNSPTAVVRQPWAKCRITANGYCDIQVPQSFLGNGTYFWVKQTAYNDAVFGSEHVMTGDYDGPTRETQVIGRTPEMRPNMVGTVINPSKEYPGYTNGAKDTKDVSFGVAAQSLKNPVLPATCNPGPKVAFVFDKSASINESDMKKYREALTGDGGVVDQLSGTNTSISIFTFDWGSPSTTDAGTNYDGLINIDTNPRVAKEELNNRLQDSSGHTNWSDGLRKAYEAGRQINDPRRLGSNHYDLVIVVTDGNPNVVGSDRWEPSRSPDVSLRSVEAAIYEANNLKSAGSRIVGITANVKGNAVDNIKRVAGPEVNHDYYSGDFSDLGSNIASSLRSVVCQSNISVTKQIKNANGSISKGAGWSFTAERGAVQNVDPDKVSLTNSSNRSRSQIQRGASVPDVTDDQGYAIWGVNFDTENQQASSALTLREQMQPGYKFEGAKCTQFKLEGGNKIPTGRTRDFTPSTAPNGSITLDGVDAIKMRQQWDCVFTNAKVDPPKLEVVKTVESASQIGEGTYAGQWDVRYKVVVSNTGSTDTTYSLSDKLRYGSGITPEAATYSLNNGSASRWASVTEEQTLTSNRSIKAGTSDTYLVNVRASLQAGNQVPNGLRCVTNDGVYQPGGFLNTAYLTGPDGKKTESSACDKPALPEIEKSPVKVEGPDRNGEYTATYTVTVRNHSNENRADGKSIYYTLEDSPKFAEGVNITSWNYRAKSFANAAPSSSQPLSELEGSGTNVPVALVEENRVLAPGRSEQFEIAFKFTLGEVAAEQLKCSTPGNTGLFNAARVYSGKQFRDANACLDVPDAPTFKLGVQKWGDDGSGLRNLGDPTQPNIDYGFSVRSPDGTVTPLTSFEQDYLTSKLVLRPNVEYQLIETKAPVGFELLPQPVTFTIEQKDGTYAVRIKDESNVPNIVAVKPTSGSDLRILRVTDVRRGALPHTGGYGVVWTLIAGFTLLIGGASAWRRRAA